MFAQVMEETMSRKIATLSNIAAEPMNHTINQIREDITRLRTQVTDLTRDVQSTAAVKTNFTWTLPATANQLPLISDPAVAVAAADRQTPR